MEIWYKEDAVKKAIHALRHVSFDEDTTNELAQDIVESLNILEDARLEAFKNYIKGDPGRIIEPAAILLNTLSDREYLLCMHFSNKIIDAMIEYAHNFVQITERQYDDRIINSNKTK